MSFLLVIIIFFPLCLDFHNAIFFMPEIQKVLTKLSKEKGCEVIARWKQACVRHFYWSVTSTTPKLGDVILAKFKAFLYHIINQHKDLPNQLFNKCAHGLIITPRVWLTKGILYFLFWLIKHFSIDKMYEVNTHRMSETTVFLRGHCL